MEHPIKRLADAISTSEKKFTECQKLMAGDESLLTTIYLHELEGMKKAFEIVAGESYFDYFLRTTEETT